MFLTWWTRFKAYATARQFGQAISNTLEAQLLPVHNTRLDSLVVGEKLQIDTRDCNNMACSAISMAILDKLILVVNAAGKADAN